MQCVTKRFASQHQLRATSLLVTQETSVTSSTTSLITWRTILLASCQICMWQSVTKKISVPRILLLWRSQLWLMSRLTLPNTLSASVEMLSKRSRLKSLSTQTTWLASLRPVAQSSKCMSHSMFLVACIGTWTLLTTTNSAHEQNTSTQLSTIIKFVPYSKATSATLWNSVRLMARG